MTKRAVTLLVLEDDPEIARLTCELLVLEGYSARSVATVREGIEVVEKTRPAAVVVDFELPDGTGLDFAVRVRSLYGQDVKLFAVSGSQESDPRVEALARICDGVFPKPINWPTLIGALHNLVAFP